MEKTLTNVHEPDEFDLMFAGTRRVVTLSVSSVVIFLMCPFKFYLKYLDPRKEKSIYLTDYERLCGNLVHRFVAGLYRKHNHTGKYFYKSIESALKQWEYLWGQGARDYKDNLLRVDYNEGMYYQRIGEKCISNYWNLNINAPAPIEIEKSYAIPLSHGFKFKGIFDQLRTTSLEKISSIRPDALVEGRIQDKYDFTIIVDLKTDPFNHNHNIPDTNGDEVMKYQFRLFQRLQVGAYTMLYQKHHSGKLPICFSIYQLRYNTFTHLFGDIPEYQIFLEESLKKVVEGITTASFPKSTGNNCRICEYKNRCDSFEKEDSDIKLPEKDLEYKQGKLKFN